MTRLLHSASLGKSLGLRHSVRRSISLVPETATKKAQCYLMKVHEMGTRSFTDERRGPRFRTLKDEVVSYYLFFLHHPMGVAEYGTRRFKSDCH